jgi:hypothetical protein
VKQIARWARKDHTPLILVASSSDRYRLSGSNLDTRKAMNTAPYILAEMSNQDTIPAVVAIAVLAGLLLAIPGIILGLREKITVYKGYSDLSVSCLIPVLAALAFPHFGFADWATWSLKVLTALLVLYSVKQSFAANRSIGKTMLAMPTKFVLLAFVTICGLFAVGGILAGLEALEKKKHKEAAKNLATGAVGAFGFYHLKKLILKLVKVSPSPP